MLVKDSLVDHLGLLYNESRDFVFLMQKLENDYEYIYTNKSAREMLGQEVIGGTVSEYTDSDAAKFIIDNYNKAVFNNDQLEFEDYAYFKYSVHKHQTTVTPVYIEENVYVLAVTKEIEFDQDLKDKYLFMRSIFFKTFLSTILIKSDGTLIEANPTFTDSFNLHLDEVRGKKFYDLPIFTDQSVLQIQKYIHSANNGDHFSSKMLTFVDHRGKEHYYTATFSPVHRGEEVVAIFLIFQDVTQYILQQNQLKTTTHGLQTLRKAMNIAAEMTITNLKGEIIEVNDRFVQRTGYSREELLGKTHNIVNSGYHPHEFFENLWETVTSGQVWRGEVRNRTKSGENYWVDSTIIPLSDEQGEVYQYLTFHFNVSDKKQMMIELRNIERTFRLITENTNDFIAVFKNSGKLIYSSPSYIRQLGYTIDEFNALSYEEILHRDSLQSWKQLLENSEDIEKDGNIELKLVTKSGEVIWTEGNYSLVYDHFGEAASQIIMVSREITERKQREDSLMFLAYHDSLTQLPNRRFLKNEFPQFVERANTAFESFAMFYIDGDNFKEVNDHYGHDVGDEFLANFGKSLLKSVRKQDLVIRIGGDEFIVIVGNLNRNPKELKIALDRVASTIRKNLEEGWIIQDTKFVPSATVGVSIYPYDGKTLDELIDYADRALCQAKQTMKSSVVIPYFEEMSEN